MPAQANCIVMCGHDYRKILIARLFYAIELASFEFVLNFNLKYNNNTFNGYLFLELPAVTKSSYKQERIHSDALMLPGKNTSSDQPKRCGENILSQKTFILFRKLVYV